LLRRYHKAHSARDLDALMPLYADNAVVVSPMFKTLHGREAIRQSFEAFFRLAPDYRVSPEEPPFIYEDDRVAEVSTASATYSEALFGLSPTGHRIEYQIVRLLTFQNGQIVDEQRLYDLAGILERLEKVRVDDELRVASDIQRTLLARSEHVGPHFEAVGRSRPSRAIGGDFFEYGDWSSGAFGLALGDVSGKGPGAALLAAMLQGMFSMEVDAAHRPSATLSRMNRALVDRRIEPRFATVFYGVLSRDGGLGYTSAGHPPPLVVRRGGGIERLSTGGPMLGVFPAAEFPDYTCRLESGDSVVAFSDGVTEATRLDGAEFGEERLIAAAQANRALAPTALVDALFDAVRDFAGDVPPKDDITVAVVRML
jgi:predicted ester cyclase